MTEDPRSPWQPHPSWADPLLLLLTLLAVLAATLTLMARHQQSRIPPARVGLQGRILEVVLAGPQALAPGTPTHPSWAQAGDTLTAPWDRALLAVLKAEANQPPAPPPPDPGGRSGAAFQAAYRAAYLQGPLPPPADRREVHHRLGGGYAADCLEARLLDREGSGEALRRAARNALALRLAGLATLGLLVGGLALGGLGVGIYLVVRGPAYPAPPLPTWGLSPRAALLVFLAWFLAFFLAGRVAALLVAPWPRLGWLALPMGYALHALTGLGLIARAEGLAPRDLWRRLVSRTPGKDLAWAGAFLSLAVFLVILVALVSQVLLRPDQNPQQDLQDLLRGLSGWAPSLLLFLTVAGLAPLFEELMFRGFLLPVLARRVSLGWALLATALLFGAIHLQPMGLPVLSTLGLVLGLAMGRTGSLRTPILVHACWNGSLFLVMRMFA